MGEMEASEAAREAGGTHSSRCLMVDASTQTSTDFRERKSLRQLVDEKVFAEDTDTEEWNRAYEKAVAEIEYEAGLNDANEYRHTMCEFGQQLLVEEIYRIARRSYI